MGEQAALVAACKLLVAAANAHEAQEQRHAAGLLRYDVGALATLQSGDLVTIARNALSRPTGGTPLSKYGERWHAPPTR